MGIDSHDSNRVVVKDCRHVFRRKFVGGVANEEAGLANRAIANYDASVGKKSCQFIDTCNGCKIV
jgi:hypothetical protein